MGHLGVVLYEYLGEEYPDVLGSILGGLKVASFPLLPSPPFLVAFRSFVIGDYQCDWNDEDDASNQRSPPSPHSHLEEQTREGAGERH